MRRADREVAAREDILKIMQKCTVLHLGMMGDGRPYVVPLHFGVEVEARSGSIVLYFHSAAAGRKTEALAKHPEVYFCMESDVQLVPAAANDPACHWTTRYASVMGEGRVTLLEDPQQKTHGLHVVLGQCGYCGETPEFAQGMLARTAVYRLDVSGISAKSNLAKL